MASLWENYSLYSKIESDKFESQVFHVSNFIKGIICLPKYRIFFKEATYPIKMFPHVLVNQR